MININCIYIVDSFNCKHPDCKKFLKIFRPMCKLVDNPFVNVCFLQEEYQKPKPTPSPPKKKYYDYTIRIVE